MVFSIEDIRVATSTLVGSEHSTIESLMRDILRDGQVTKQTKRCLKKSSISCKYSILIWHAYFRTHEDSMCRIVLTDKQVLEQQSR